MENGKPTTPDGKVARSDSFSSLVKVAAVTCYSDVILSLNSLQMEGKPSPAAASTATPSSSAAPMDLVVSP